jgi:hypothetical protein
MDYKKFFLSDNKSGIKTKEDFIKKNHIDIFENIVFFIEKNNLSNDLTFKEKIFLFINNIDEQPKCNNCGKELKFKKSLKEGYGSFCSIKCNNQSKKQKEKIKNTFNKKYGGHPMSSQIVKDKVKKTNLEKYGVDNIFKDSEYIIKKTKEKLGVSNPNKLNHVKEKKRVTNNERYGVDTNLLLCHNREKNLKSKLKKFNKKYKSLNIINDRGNYVSLGCDKCNNIYDIDRSLLFYRFDNKLNCCTVCNPVSELRSIKEKELSDFISSLGFDITISNRDLLKGKEIDILIKDKNIGFELNGLYYHSDLFKDKNYHIDKTIECKKEGIRLIHIFEDEWDNKKDIVKSRIKNLLGLTDNKIYGRKCSIKKITTKIKTKFLNDNHIQGTVGSKINYGLYYDDELVSIMTFGKGRNIMNGKNYEWELLRFCNKINYNVIGGASKLLKHFIKVNNPNNIISYADIRWSNGNLYDILGFNHINTSQPNYFYIINKKREHRYKFRKDILISEGFDKNKTEHEIMSDRGYNKIYDCGNMVYFISL